MKALICTFLLVSLCLTGCVQNHSLSDSTKTEDGGDDRLFYNDLDRVLTEGDFSFLEKGMSLDEIDSVVGRPNGFSGFNILTPFYTLEDGRLSLVFDDPLSVSFEYLLYYTISCLDGERRKVDLE